MKKIILLLMICMQLTSAQWYNFREQNSGVTTELTSSSSSRTLSGFSGQTNWVCGYNGVVLRSRSGDSVWISTGQNGIPSNVSLINIYAYDTLTALTAGYIGSNTYVYRTTNKGQNWSQVFYQAGGFINAIITNELNFTGKLFMVGDPVGGRWSIWKSTNAGLTWDSTGLFLPQAGTETGYNNCISGNLDRICFGTNNSRIYITTNGGLNWISRPINQPNIYAIWTTGYYTIAAGTSISISNDFGANWTNVTPPGTGNITGLGFIATQWGYFTRGSQIYMTNNSGMNWYLDYTAPSGTYRFLNNTVPYVMYVDAMAVRNNGGISKGHLALYGIEPGSGKIPDGFKLHQNYPNPFNPYTVISFECKMYSRVMIRIYDAMGKEVDVLLDKNTGPGKYEVKFDGSKYPSGVYFYQMVVKSANFTETRKMLLIK